MEKKELVCSDLCIDDSPAVVLANLKNYVDNAQVANNESVFDNFKAQMHLLCIKEKLIEYFSVKEHLTDSGSFADELADLHMCRRRLHLHDFLTDDESEIIKTKIDKRWP